MHPDLSAKNYGSSDSSKLKPFLVRSLNGFRRTFVAGLIVSLLWLSAFVSPPALAMSIAPSIPVGIASQVINPAVQGDRMIALITCLPKQLSQPNLKRALNEMGNDQLERVFNLKANPKLSQAEVDLASCLNRRES